MRDQLIPIHDSVKISDVSETVNARELHAFLEVQTRFNDWISNRIREYGFVENQDFTTFTENPVKGRPRTEYHLTIDMAKELSMVERNEKGRQARRYFIDMERHARQAVSAPAIDPRELRLQINAFRRLYVDMGLAGPDLSMAIGRAVRAATGFDLFSEVAASKGPPRQRVDRLVAELKKAIVDLAPDARVTQLSDITLFGLKIGVEKEFLVAGALAHEDGTVINATAYIRGRLTKSDHGSWKSGEVGENDFSIALRYYRLEAEGRTLIEADPFSVSVGGVSQTAAIRAALLV